MTTKIDYEYFEWLASQIDIPNGKSYGGLFERMHNTEFHWTVPNDDNRLADAMDLRRHFSHGHLSDQLALEFVTFLEVMIALSRRTAFTAGGEPGYWAWRLIKNLRLHKKSDPLTEQSLESIDNVLYSVIWRTYQPDGRGGFFPLTNPMEDQTKVEIWYQMNKYVIEMHSP